MKQKISLIGFGRFGQTLYRLIKDDFAVTLYNRSPIKPQTVDLAKDTIITHDLNVVYQSQAIFYAVPISNFEQVIAGHQQYFRKDQLLIDVLSVKVHPAQIFNKYLQGSQTQALLTHPMFGPDSSQHGFAGLSIILDKFRTGQSAYNFWKTYFQSKKLRVIEMPAAQHDEIAANSQGLTHFIGRLLEKLRLEPTPIDSLGAQKLWEIKAQTCNDTWQLFSDLQHYNPHTKHMRLRLGEAYDQLYNDLLPQQVSPDFLTFGIQGGKGSFNEEAMLYFLAREGIANFQIKYLHTSARVLAALHQGEIDRGQFAVHNSVGGIVEESIQAMAKYKFRIIDQFAIKISHALMIRPDVDFKEVTTIMSHPQVFAQCRINLLKKYPHLQQTSGEGELIDHALVAKYLSENKLPSNLATMGSKVLAEIYKLKVVEDNLQDAKENYTSFLLAARG